MEVSASLILLLGITLSLFVQNAQGRHLRQRKTSQDQELDELRLEEDPMINAWLLKKIITKCIEYPEECTDTRLVHLFSKSEKSQTVDGNSHRSKRDVAKIALTRTKRNNHFLWNLFDDLHGPNRRGNQRGRASNQSGANEPEVREGSEF